MLVRRNLLYANFEIFSPLSLIAEMAKLEVEENLKRFRDIHWLLKRYFFDQKEDSKDCKPCNLDTSTRNTPQKSKWAMIR